MNDSDIDGISAWVTRRGLEGASETELLHGFCDRCRATGLDLSRALAIIDTLHPVYEGRAFKWRSKQSNESPVIEYGPTSEGEAAERWQQSPFNYLLQSGEGELRRRARPDPARGIAPARELLRALSDGAAEWCNRARPLPTWCRNCRR